VFLEICFSDAMLSLTTKCMIYQAVVLGVLLYAVETWSVKQREVRTLETFHHRFLRTLLGNSLAMQISQHISNEEVRSRVGMSVTLADMISCRRLRWLGHVARMGMIAFQSNCCLDGCPNTDHHMG